MGLRVPFALVPFGLPFSNKVYYINVNNNQSSLARSDDEGGITKYTQFLLHLVLNSPD